MEASIRVNRMDGLLRTDTVASLVGERAEQTQGRGIAVSLNGAVVPRAAWASTMLRAGDQVEIVRALQGG